MKKSIFISCLLLISALSICARETDSAKLTGPYMGQKPPEMTPEVFAPGIVSTGHEEFKAVYSPDGKELYYQVWGASFPVILTMREVEGIWTKPKVASFSEHMIEGFKIG